jgi:hypothetical protein
MPILPQNLRGRKTLNSKFSHDPKKVFYFLSGAMAGFYFS